MKKVKKYLEESKNWKLYKQILGNDDKYLSAFTHIFYNHPKLILEYGGGTSTFILSVFLEELNYGGKIVGFEEIKEWYDYHIEQGFNKYNNIVYVEKMEVEDDCITYLHDLEPYKDVDFIILDGPDYRQYGDRLGVTLNLQKFVEYTNREIPYFIDGRQGCIEYYEKPGYTSEIKDIKGSSNPPQSS